MNTLQEISKLDHAAMVVIEDAIRLAEEANQVALSRELQNAMKALCAAEREIMQATDGGAAFRARSVALAQAIQANAASRAVV
jgi:hypothetical protein